jgi:hypothetical protein
MDLASLLSGVGSLGLGTVLGSWISGRRDRRAVQASVIRALEKVENARWFTSTNNSIDPVRTAVAELEETALRAGLPRQPVMLYSALAVASWRISEKDSDHRLWTEWADVVTDARDVVKNLVWQDDSVKRDGRDEADLVFRRARAVTRRSVVSVWAESPGLRAYARIYGAVEPAESGTPDREGPAVVG